MKSQRVPLFAVGLASVFILGACSSGTNSDAADQRESSQPTTGSINAGYPVTIDNCGRQVTIQKEPERVITGYQNTVELMIALGLEEKVVGRQPFTQSPLLPEQETAFKAIPELTPGLPDNQQSMAASREVQLAAQPDFVLASGSFEVDSSRGVASIDDFKNAGANVYVLSTGDGSKKCGDKSTTELLFQDIKNLGIIFSVEDRADKLINDLKSDIDEVKSKISNERPVRLFAYDSGEGPLIGIGNSYFDFSMAGAENVVKTDETYPELSQEAIAGANPQVILTANYEPGPLEPESKKKEEYLRSALPNSEAVINNRFVHIESIDLTPGIRNARAIRTIATELYPDSFK